MGDKSRRTIITSIIVFFVFVALATLGVAINEEWRGVVYLSRALIGAAIIFAVGYFFMLTTKMRNQPENYAGLLARFGIAPQNNAFSPDDLKRIRSLYILPAMLTFTIWLVAFPYWMVYGFAMFAIIGVVAVCIIAYWKEIPSGFWEKYYGFLWRALLVMTAIFFIYAPFARMWENLFTFAQGKATVWAEGLNKPAQKQTSTLGDEAQKLLAKKAQEANEQNRKNQEAKQGAKAEAEDETDNKSEDTSSKQSAPQGPASSPAATNESKENRKPETDDSDAERERLLDAAEKALDADVDLSRSGATNGAAKPVSPPKQAPALKRPAASKREWSPKMPNWITRVMSPKAVKF